MTQEGIISTANFCNHVAESLERQANEEGAKHYGRLARILETIEDPETAFGLIDTGLFNDIIVGYAAEAARRAGLDPEQVRTIKEETRAALDDISAEEIL